jgi:ribose-phosphate pyrophosphokinase
MDAELVVFSGNANQPLASKICQWLDVPIGQAVVSQFSDGETRVELQENVRGRDVFIIQSMSSPTNHHIMEAMIMADACHRSSADRITLVAPYFGYARQERKSAPRTPITAKLLADMIETAQFNRVLTMELHTSAIQGFFNIPVDHLYAKPIFSAYFTNLTNPVVVSPDAGGVERARAMAKHFNCGLAIVDKRRDKPNESTVMHIIGDVEGKNCIIIDDIVDTAGSITQASEALLRQGANTVTAAISHPVLSGPALDRINRSNLKELLVTDSILLSKEARECSKIKQLGIAELFGKAIRRIHNDDSISALFI